MKLRSFVSGFLKKVELTQRFIQDDGYGIGEVKASNVRINHRDREASVPICMQQIFRQTMCFSTKEQAIVDAKLPIEVRAFCFG